jgi:hypothetical protein
VSSRMVIANVETHLAIVLSDLHWLWEPGPARDERIDETVDSAIELVERVAGAGGGRSRGAVPRLPMTLARQSRGMEGV